MRRTRQYGEHNDTRQDPLSAEERALQVMRIENASTALIDFGVKTVKNNPGKVGGWLVGLLICLLFSGFQVSQESYAKHDQVRRSIDFHSLYEAEDLMFSTKKDYDRRKGWFWTCNKDCQVYKKIYEQERAAFAVLEKQKVEKVREANAEIGLLSTVGVEDTRNKFWSSFDGGKRFATRQSKWDALFMGISALQKNEKISSYLLRVFMNFIMNFTLGVVMAVIGFWVALWGLMVEYKAGLLTCLLYTSGAVLASLSFAFSFLVLLYIGAAGTVYVGAKVLATSVRIEDRPRNHLN